MKAPQLCEIAWRRISGMGPRSTIERWEEDDGLPGPDYMGYSTRLMVKIESARSKQALRLGSMAGYAREIKNRPHPGINVHPSKKCRDPGQ